MDVRIDLRKKVSENASLLYGKSKKSKSKLSGAKKALDETRKNIEKLKVEVPGGEVSIKKKPKRRWFDKFRWFYSSDGFLVVGGKDAETNELLIKRHLDSTDLVFHADVHGAPFFVVKNPGGLEIPERTRRETAQAAAAYSSAWKQGIGSCDVYSVAPGQVSKTPEPGEYLAKGAFVIRGEREWFRNTELMVAVGIRLADSGIVGGPVDSVRSNSDFSVMIGVGDKKSEELAREIAGRIEEGRKDAGRADINEIQRWIPSGRGKLLK